MTKNKEASSDPQSATASRPRVGYMLRMYPRFTQTFVVNEILELERQGVDVRILSLRKPTDGRFHESLSRVRAQAEYLPEFLVEARSKILNAHWQQFRSRKRQYLRAATETYRHAGADSTDFQQAAMALRWAKKNKLKHVHVHFGTHEATVAYLAHLMGGLSYSLTLHAFDIFRSNVDRPLLARKINASQFIVTVSEYNRAFMLENLPGVDPDKIRVNYNGIDLESFAVGDAPRRPYSVLGVGRLIEKKGYIDLVRAMARLRDMNLPVSCTIVGDGPQTAMLQGEIDRLKLTDSVTLAGARSQDFVREALQQAACFVLPCVHAADGNVDALPTVLLEAMASGCPCVSTRVSGVPEIIEHDSSGMLVEPSDDAALADAMAAILSDADTATAFSDAGRRRAELVFDIRNNVGRMKSWFAEVIAHHKSRTRKDGRRKAAPDTLPVTNAVECAR